MPLLRQSTSYIVHNAPINVNSAGEGGSASKRSGFDNKTDPSIGHLIASRIPGIGTFDFDREAPGSNLQTRLPSVFLLPLQAVISILSAIL